MKSLSFYILLLFILPSCSDEESEVNCSVTPSEDDTIFEFKHTTTGILFQAWTSDAQVIANADAQLALTEVDRNMHINGVILELPDGCDLNNGYSWYFDPDGWDMAELSIELCDGEPAFVEENLSEYVDVIGRYCPWSSIVMRRID